MPRVKWIGVKIPSTDERIGLRQITGGYTPMEQATLDAAAIVLTPLVAVPGSTQRNIGPESGLSRTYQWGTHPASYVQQMTDLDAKRLFASASEGEFRNLDDPAHDDRVPVVPESIIDEVLYRILMAAHNGPPVSLSTPMLFRDPEAMMRKYAEISEAARG